MPETPEPTPTGQTAPGRRPPRKRGSTRTKTSGTSPSKLRKKALSKRIIDLRLEGLSVRKIADRLQRGGFKTSKSEVQEILAKELEELGASQETREQARALSLDRLDAWTQSLFRRTKKGDEKAIGTALKLEERRSKLLGTDAPEEQQVKLTILGQVNWLFDIIERELGADAAQRVLRRISDEGGPPKADAGGPPG
jgi:hypothetical protein